MYGDSKYQWLFSGSTAASADDTAKTLFGGYGGLSSLNEDEVVFLEVRAITNSLRIFPTVSSSATQFGYLHTAGSHAAYDSYPGLRVGDASQLGFANHTATADGTLYWQLWRRK